MLKIVWASEYFDTFRFPAQIYYMGTVSWPGLTFSEKCFLLKWLSCFEFCYIICSICCYSVLAVFVGIVLLFHCSTGVLQFHYSVVFQLFRQCSIVPPVFQYSTSVPCSIVPCSGVSGFIVCRLNLNNAGATFAETGYYQKINRSKIKIPDDKVPTIPNYSNERYPSLGDPLRNPTSRV